MGETGTAVVGLGFIGVTHVEMMHRLGRPVIGVQDENMDRAQEAARRLRVPKVYSSYAELLHDRHVDIVHICTPNYLHYEMCKAALLAGKHVICEKPLAMNTGQSAELVDLAKDCGLVAVANYNLRFYPLCHEARAKVRGGEIGDVRLIHGGYLQDWLFLPTDWNWRLESARGGELRAVADIGSHWLDTVSWITGLRITRVMADFATFMPKRFKPRREVDTFAGKVLKSHDVEEVEVDTEDCATVLLRFDSGALGNVTISQISAGRKNHFWWELTGSQASVSWDSERPNEMWIGYRDEPNKLLLKDPALMHPEARAIAGFPGGHAEGYGDTFFRLYEAVYNYLDAGDFSQPADFATFEDGHRQMVLCEAILRSARQACWVQVPAP